MNKCIFFFQKAFLIFFFIFSCTNKQTSSSNTIEELRAKKVAEFLDPTKSPLDAEELKTFKGITFFSFDERYKVKASLTKMPDMPVFDMPHSLNRTYKYQKFGEVTFTLFDKKFTLPIYTNDALKKDSSLFFSFSDLTNGKQTYGGGKYMDVHYDGVSNEIELDFNESYFPYCAYSHRYSCPIVPKENHIDLEIKAGEKFND